MVEAEKITARARAIAQEKGVEGWIKKAYPELYEVFKREAEASGRKIIDVIMEHANYGLSVKRYQGLISEEDLKDITPKSLYASIKLLNWASQQYFTTLAYANVSVVEALQQLVFNVMMRIQSMYYGGGGGEGGKGGGAVPPPIPPMYRKTIADKIVDLVIEGLRTGRAMIESSTAPPQSVSKRAVEKSVKAISGVKGK